jgi:hypothetical protein
MSLSDGVVHLAEEEQFGEMTSKDTKLTAEYLASTIQKFKEKMIALHSGGTN